MTRSSFLPVSIRKFDKGQYIEASALAKSARDAGDFDNPLAHFIDLGIDENAYTPLHREPLALTGAVERFLISDSGFCLIIGWLADEGFDQPRFKLMGGGFNVEFPAEAIFRHARSDVEAHIKTGAYDFGFVGFGRLQSKSLLKQSLLFQVTAIAGSFQIKVTPEVVSDKRILDTLLEVCATFQAHAGRTVVLSSFLAEPAGQAMIDLFQKHVASSIAQPYVETFGRRRVSSSFVTVLFGSTEPMLLQPVLFRNAGIDFGEWIYVCNSPEDGETMLRYAKLISNLYDVMITVIVNGDNAGFGAANNVAITRAASNRIFIINPDVYPMAPYARQFQTMLSEFNLGQNLWGGLLFYDHDNLMHSGMYFESDVFIRRNSLNRILKPGDRPQYCKLLRVEHFDKGVPFDEAIWKQAREVPAITGAVMAFERSCFDALDGFSTRYIYGHYEDADLSLRWKRNGGRVAVLPDIKLVHLEGQGSRARGEQYRGAAIVNRYFFTDRHGGFFESNKDDLSQFSQPVLV